MPNFVPKTPQPTTKPEAVAPSTQWRNPRRSHLPIGEAVDPEARLERARRLGHRVVVGMDSNDQGSQTRPVKVSKQQRLGIQAADLFIQRAYDKVPAGTKSGDWVQSDTREEVDCWFNAKYPQWHFTVWLATEDEHVSCGKGTDKGTKVGYVKGVEVQIVGPKRKGTAGEQACLERGWEVLHDARASIMLNYIDF